MNYSTTLEQSKKLNGSKAKINLKSQNYPQGHFKSNIKIKKSIYFQFTIFNLEYQLSIQLGFIATKILRNRIMVNSTFSYFGFD